MENWPRKNQDHKPYRYFSSDAPLATTYEGNSLPLQARCMLVIIPGFKSELHHSNCCVTLGKYHDVSKP